MFLVCQNLILIFLLVLDTTCCGSIRFNARKGRIFKYHYVLPLNLTRSDSRMKVRLMVLPDKLSGGACENSESNLSQKYFSELKKEILNFSLSR